jgi:hypothetical protein
MFMKTENPAAREMRCVICFWEQFDHPPLSPDLKSRDSHLFLHLKSFLAGRRFHDDEIKEAVTTCFASQAASFCDRKK